MPGSYFGNNTSVTGGSSLLFGFEDNDENLQIMDRIIKQKMNEICQLKLVPTNKFAQMIERYVQSNETHGLETFIDHEVFRKSYHEVRRSLIEQPGAVESFSKAGGSVELET